jgi:hypothetical protein
MGSKPPIFTAWDTSRERWGQSVREEARKSWPYFVSNVTVYLCDFFLGQLEGRSGGLDWFSEYESGNVWLDYHLRLSGQRPAELRAIIEFVPAESVGMYDHLEFGGASSEEAVLIEIAKLAQLPKGVIPKPCPSFVRLQIPDDVHCVGWKTLKLSIECCNTLRVIDVVDRELGFGVGGVGLEQRELPRELIKPRPEGISEVSCQERDHRVGRADLYVYDVALVNHVVMFRDAIWTGVVVTNPRVHLIEMGFRPHYFEIQKIDPAMAVNHAESTENV